MLDLDHEEAIQELLFAVEAFPGLSLVQEAFSHYVPDQKSFDEFAENDLRIDFEVMHILSPQIQIPVIALANFWDADDLLTRGIVLNLWHPVLTHERLLAHIQGLPWIVSNNVNYQFEPGHIKFWVWTNWFTESFLEALTAYFKLLVVLNDADELIVEQDHTLYRLISRLLPD